MLEQLTHLLNTGATDYFHTFLPLRPPQISEITTAAVIRNMGEATPIMIPKENPNSHIDIGVTITIVKITQ